MNKITSSIIISGLGLLLLAGTAFAHVTVNPRSTEPGYGVATVRVPNEKDNPTVGFRVVVPEGVVVNAVKPVPGWTFAVTREDAKEAPTGEGDEESGPRITEISWTGGQIAPGEFEEFPLSVQYTKTGDIAWKAYQTYLDGETINWDGGKDAKNPASAVAVAESKGDAPLEQGATPSGPTQWISILALLTALAALFVSLRKK